MDEKWTGLYFAHQSIHVERYFNIYSGLTNTFHEGLISLTKCNSTDSLSHTKSHKGGQEITVSACVSDLFVLLLNSVWEQQTLSEKQGNTGSAELPEFRRVSHRVAGAQ